MSRKNLLLVFAVIAVAASGQGFASSIQNVTLQTPLQAPPNMDLDSDHIVWVSDGMGGFQPYSPLIPAPPGFSGRKPPPYEPYLVGNSSAPGSNIELSTLDGGIGSPDYQSWLDGTSVTTLTGDHGPGTSQVILMSLTFDDWFANGFALAEDYLTGFVVETLGIPLTPVELAAAAYVFVTGDTGGTPAPEILSPAYILSDPNIAYANLEGGTLKIGLAGLYDATAYLEGFASLIGIPLTPPTQLSEVAKLTYDGRTQYIYSFSATDSHQQLCFPNQTNLMECSFRGNYEVMIPEPASVTLLSLGLLGLKVRRRLAAR